MWQCTRQKMSKSVAEEDQQSGRDTMGQCDPDNNEDWNFPDDEMTELKERIISVYLKTQTY